MRGKMPGRVLVRSAADSRSFGDGHPHRLGASVAVVADYEGANLPFDFLADLLVDENFRVVCAENSDLDILVVQPTEERTRRNASSPLNRSGYRRILVQGTMCPRLIIVARE